MTSGRSFMSLWCIENATTAVKNQLKQQKQQQFN